MKPKLTVGISILISLALLAFGLVYGSVSGYADERAHVAALLGGDNGITSALGYRASDGLNLCVVAERHIAGEPAVATLRQAALALRAQGLTAPALREADAALEAAFTAVAASLRANPSFTASARDPKYLDMLAADFAEYAQSPIFQAYNEAANAFNQKLQTPVLGDLARFFGVTPCERY